MICWGFFMVLFLEFWRGWNRGRIRLCFYLYFLFFFFMKDLTCIYGLRLLSVVLSRIFVLFTLFCIVVMVFVLHGLKIQAIFFFYWATDWTWGGGAHRARGARRGGFGFRKKKTRLINGAGSGFRVRPTSRVQAKRNPTRCHS